MMKHETVSKPIPIRDRDTHMEKPVTPTIKRSLWRNRSVTEAPVCSRSPITKAFDFLPWSRNKKTTEKTLQQQQQQQQQQHKEKEVASVTSSDNNRNVEERKDANIHYHRNIFRSGGGLIRDILGGDKPHKEKANCGQQQQQQPQQHQLMLRKSSQRSKPKQVVARNKSLDINELINTVENELATEKHKNGRNHFIDDTFIENILRAKEAYHQGSNSQPQNESETTAEQYMYGDDVEGGSHQKYHQRYEHHNYGQQNADDGRSNLHTTKSVNSSNGGGNIENIIPIPPRHILFNDEDTVYLIKKELPVKREMSKPIRKTSPNYAASADFAHHQHEKQQQLQQLQQHQQHQQHQQRERNEHNESVLRARLKFKKLTPEGTPVPEHTTAQTQRLHNNQAYSVGAYNQIHSHAHPYTHSNSSTHQRNFLASKSVIDKYGREAEYSKRGILQRQNTTPASLSAYGGGENNTAALSSPELRRRQHQLYQRGEQRVAVQRRKSFTDSSNFESPHTTQFQHSSSSSSMGSGAGVVCGDGDGNGDGGAAGTDGALLCEQPKLERPRKKLSFREPIVAEKPRVRRRSSPLQRPLSVGAAESLFNDGQLNHLVDNVCMRRATESGSAGGSAGGSLISTVVPVKDVSCDNLCGSSHNIAPQDNLYTMPENNTFDTTGCAYVDNTDLTIDLESQAMRIVRTVGQAFEVCHKFNLHKNSLDHNDERSDVSSEILDVERLSEQQLTDDEQAKKEQLTVATETKPPQRPNHLELVPHSSLNMRKSPSLQPAEEDKSPTTPSSPSHEITKLKDQLEQQAIQTRQALAQLMLVREQLISETNARIEAQARTQQLLQQNRELLEHLASLGAYNEQQTAGLTSANIGMAPQLQMLLHATNNNNNLATINQQINSLGSINQQLTSLSHQLSGLNQQSQNLQQFQNINAVSLQSTSTQQQQQQQKSQLTPPTPAASMHLSVTPTNVTNSNNNINNNSGGTSTNTSPFPSMNQLQSISNQLQQINTQSTQHQQDLLSKDLFQVNQELLNRLQALNLNASTSNALSVNNTSGIGVGVGGGAGAGMTAQQTPSPHNSFFFVNPMSCSPSNNNNNANNFNFLNSPNTLTGNLTPSPMGTLTRNSYTHSPQPQQDNEVLRINSIDKNLNCLIDEQLMKPGTSNGNLASISTSCSSSTVDSPSSPRIRNTNNEPRFNTVMLRVTDESGNVTNQRKLSATPSFIQRSTSEKVPNRSQMMSQVQRTAWARHTTK